MGVDGKRSAAELRYLGGDALADLCALAAGLKAARWKEISHRRRCRWDVAEGELAGLARAVERPGEGCSKLVLTDTCLREAEL